MKKLIYLFIAICTLSLFSCEKDEGNLPNISFVTGADYISADATKAGGSVIHIGISASKAETKDVLKQFNVSKSVNGAPATTVFETALYNDNGNFYNYNFAETLESTPGQTNRYTFTVTNRDGLVNQVALTVTIQ